MLTQADTCTPLGSQGGLHLMQDTAIDHSYCANQQRQMMYETQTFILKQTFVPYTQQLSKNAFRKFQHRYHNSN